MQKQGKVTFLREREIWTAKADGSDLRQLTTNNGLRKNRPLWSPDGKKIAYLTDPDPGEEANSKNRIIAKIIIINDKGERLMSIPIRSELLIDYVFQEEWINNMRFGYEGRINPSLGEYRIIDTESGNVIATYLGARFSWSSDKTKLAQLGKIVHFAPSQSQNESVQINGKTVSSLPKGRVEHYVKTELTWSPASHHLAFIEKHEPEGNEKLVILTPEGKPELAWEVPAALKEVRKIDWLDEKTLLLSQFGRTYVDGPMWKFDWGQQRAEFLDKEAKKSQAVDLLKEATEREQLMQKLGGKHPDWWFEKSPKGSALHQ